MKSTDIIKISGHLYTSRKFDTTCEIKAPKHLQAPGHIYPDEPGKGCSSCLNGVWGETGDKDNKAATPPPPHPTQ